MDLRIRIENVLTRLRPYLQADGGDIELLDVMGSKARVRLTGKCAGCPSAHLTLYVGVDRRPSTGNNRPGNEGPAPSAADRTGAGATRG